MIADEVYVPLVVVKFLIALNLKPKVNQESVPVAPPSKSITDAFASNDTLETLT